mmetsp:Transcript_49502/g.107215  ORF Transcript_49502/g.107215 Transcript_49502/m.107215 type:complete len:273 (+) Transcript_49502:174-992(+)
MKSVLGKLWLVSFISQSYAAEFGRLQVQVREARYVTNVDSPEDRVSDPFVTVAVGTEYDLFYKSCGRTRTIWDDLNPRWFQWLDCGCVWGSLPARLDLIDEEWDGNTALGYHAFRASEAVSDQWISWDFGQTLNIDISFDTASSECSTYWESPPPPSPPLPPPPPPSPPPPPPPSPPPPPPPPPSPSPPSPPSPPPYWWSFYSPSPPSYRYDYSKTASKLSIGAKGKLQFLPLIWMRILGSTFSIAVFSFIVEKVWQQLGCQVDCHEPINYC